ncbi:MAG: hypothetical protein ACOCXX_02035 [Planctomycetota bacterium]
MSTTFSLDQYIECLARKNILDIVRGVDYLVSRPEVDSGRIGDLVDVPELIAPRPLLVNAGTDDLGSPIDEVRRKIEQLRDLYREVDAPDNLVYNEERTGHRFTETMKKATLAFFKTHL